MRASGSTHEERAYRRKEQEGKKIKKLTGAMKIRCK
jgi:hypothetical protein